jgi:hypothetical protein
MDVGPDGLALRSKGKIDKSGSEARPGMPVAQGRTTHGDDQE